MGIPLKSNSQFVIVACLLLALLCANIHRASSFSTIETAGSGNATTGGAVEYVADDEEFLMESEVSRRILAGKFNGIKTAVLQTVAFCDAKGNYANCDSLKVNKQSRDCPIETRCRHSA